MIRRSGAIGAIEELQHVLAHVVDVEVEQRRIGPEHDDARRGFGRGMAHQRGEVVGARNAAQQHALGQREAADQHREREHARDQHALQDAERPAPRAMVTIAITNSALLTRSSWRSSSILNMLCTEASTSAASSGCGSGRRGR